MTMKIFALAVRSERLSQKLPLVQEPVPAHHLLIATGKHDYRVMTPAIPVQRTLALFASKQLHMLLALYAYPVMRLAMPVHQQLAQCVNKQEHMLLDLYAYPVM